MGLTGDGNIVRTLRETGMDRRRIRRTLAAIIALAVGPTVAGYCEETASTEEKGLEMSGITLRSIESNGITLRIAEQGEGPLVIMLHGFPESWYSWRHQLPALAEAGYHAVAPDLRGYGKSDKPESIQAYDIVQLTADIVGIVDAMGQETAVVVGHDWGAPVAWHCALLHPDRFSAVVGMSVPYAGRGGGSPIEGMKGLYGDNFFYILYFQEPGVAEAELDADPHAVISRMYTSPDTPREAPEITDPKASAGGLIGRMGKPKELPPWLTQEDLDYFVGEFAEAGFRGGINFYRNIERNWEITPQLAGAQIKQPSCFIAGEMDMVIRTMFRAPDAERLEAIMQPALSDLRGVKVFKDAGHWVQQERPAETNAALIEFLDSLK